MLTKRTQVLFDKNSYKALEDIASKKGKSVGALVREAVEIVYLLDDFDIKKIAYQNILKNRKVSKTKLNYKQLRDNGRKY